MVRESPKRPRDIFSGRVTFEWIIRSPAHFVDYGLSSSGSRSARRLRTIMPMERGETLQLVRDEFSVFDAVHDRSWAKVDRGRLPLRFTFTGDPGQRGEVIPAQLREELAAELKIRP